MYLFCVLLALLCLLFFITMPLSGIKLLDVLFDLFI